ncbi:hypothetical protein [Pandoraea pulmonicola]|uniref:Uncharacterized protein n=1 Tax=Pandoraea pulmonicola TaxID=93221 RepID=A0AAJ4Z9V0_PANPU|nr:hypothetical protein [Pandoraea pulmonicola]AJC21642.1 hypothetical protein RO07_16225 [Pandoraea pulmonicola]SUA89508.1 Uncharacterised protein [Pandoraea pulmonicola]
MRGFKTWKFATGWLVAGMFGLAGHAQAQSGSPARTPVAACNCAQIVADCSASVTVLPTRALNGAFSADVTLQTDAPSCARIDYQLDDTPYVTILRDGAMSTQRLYGARPLTRNSLSHMSCHVCAAASAPVANDGLPPDMARVDGAPGTFSAAPMAPVAAVAPSTAPAGNVSTYAPPAATAQNAALASTAPPSSIGDTAGLNAVNTPNTGTPELARDVAAIDAPAPAVATIVTPPIAPGAPDAAAGTAAAAPLRVVNPSGRWRGLCKSAPPWWGIFSSPMTRLMALALNGSQVTGSVDDVEPNIHTTVQGSLAGDRLQLAGSYGAKHDITFGADGTTLTDAWCNGDGRCETCEMQRF